MDNIQNRDRRFIYFYFNRNQPAKIGRIIPAHVEYWKTANLKGYMGGPFADRTGGLISFVATDFQQATGIILKDPFLLEDLVAERSIKEWLAE